MSVPEPLGVRIYSPPMSYDMWVTENVADFSYRMGVPGGMLDATFEFRKYTPIGQPDATIWSPTTSAVSVDNQSFKVTNPNSALINPGDRFWVYDSSGNIKFNGDRFTVTGKSTSGILNSNSDFESGTSGWTSAGVTFSTVPTTRPGDIGSIAKMVPDGVTGVVRIEQSTHTSVTAGNTYTASGWLYCEVARIVELNINWYDASNVLLSTSLNQVAVPSNTWIFSTVDFVAPAGAVFASVIPRMTGTPSTTHILYVDNAALSSGITTVSYAPFSSALIASGDTVLAKVPASFWDSSLTGFNKMINLFNRVQVVDLRTMEVAWEGRIESPARETGKDVWTLGCLGTSVIASDIERPMYYLDDTLESWLEHFNLQSFAMTSTIDTANSKMKIAPPKGEIWSTSGVAAAPNVIYLWAHQQTEACDTEGIARFDAILNGQDDSTSLGKLGITLDMAAPGRGNPASSVNIGSYILSVGAADYHLQRLIGTHWTNWESSRIYLEFGFISTSTTSTTPGATTFGTWTLPKVQSIRMDRFRNVLNTAASYPNAALQIGPVVEDILGRFLNGGHTRLIADVPKPGHIDPYSAYIDKTYTQLMVSGWIFPDGVTAKELLDKLVTEAATDSYWAIWESSYNNTESASASKCKFEFVRWPVGWGYQFTSVDGITEQPDASEEYNVVFYKAQWEDSNPPGSQYVYINASSETYLNGPFNFASDVGTADITRSKTLTRDKSLGATDGAKIGTESAEFLYNSSRPKNAGQIKISQPAYLYDPGVGRPNGAGRMMDPWHIRPGKLCRVIDIEPRGMMNNFNYGNTAVPKELDGTVFRMTNTEYSTADNTCTIDLDQNVSWSIPNQVIAPQKPRITSGNTYYR